MTAGRFDGLLTGPCRFCGHPTITRVRLERGGIRGAARRLLRRPYRWRWVCTPCLSLRIDRIRRGQL